MTSLENDQKKAVVLLSGGLDSCTTLAIAIEQGFDACALSFDYGQRHSSELAAARLIAEKMRVQEHRVMRLDLGTIGGSALTDLSIDVPEAETEGVPITYVPARNTVFLALALAWAEVLGCRDLFIGVNAIDYSGYPDCRPEFIAAFETTANLATKAGVEGASFTIHTPLIHLSKSRIIQEGTRLNCDYGLTVSCYQADSKGLACGVCESCRFRHEGFRDAGIPDPTRYRLQSG